MLKTDKSKNKIIFNTLHYSVGVYSLGHCKFTIISE